MSENETTTTNEVYKLHIEPIEFKGTMKTMMLTTNDLCKSIGSVFSNVTKDYQGARITVDRGYISAQLYFSMAGDAPDGMYKFVDTYQNSVKEKNVMLRFNNSIRKNRVMSLTDTAKSMLSDFIPQYDPISRVIYINNKNEVQWNNASREYSVNVPNSGGLLPGSKLEMFMIVPFDLTKFLKSLYGVRDKNTRYEYSIAVVRPMNNIQLGDNRIISTNWLINIIQYDNNKVMELAKATNSFPTDNILNIIK